MKKEANVIGNDDKNYGETYEVINDDEQQFVEASSTAVSP